VGRLRNATTLACGASRQKLELLWDNFVRHHTAPVKLPPKRFKLDQSAGNRVSPGIEHNESSRWRPWPRLLAAFRL
jgi:hypothetical protein